MLYIFENMYVLMEYHVEKNWNILVIAFDF